MLLRDATLQDGSRADVRIAGETIDAVSSPGRLGVVPDEEVHELAGYVVLPAMAEPHAHLDKAFTAARVVNTPGNLIEAIETWSVHRATVSVEDVAVRARAGALLALARGATAIRSHVDVGEGIGLRAVEALLQVREELRASIDIQVVALAFPLTGRAGVANRALLREALAMGVDVVGARPTSILTRARTLTRASPWRPSTVARSICTWTSTCVQRGSTSPRWLPSSDAGSRQERSRAIV